MKLKNKFNIEKKEAIDFTKKIKHNMIVNGFPFNYYTEGQKFYVIKRITLANSLVYANEEEINENCNMFEIILKQLNKRFKIFITQKNYDFYKFFEEPKKKEYNKYINLAIVEQNEVLKNQLKDYYSQDYFIVLETNSEDGVKEIINQNFINTTEMNMPLSLNNIAEEDFDYLFNTLQEEIKKEEENYLENEEGEYITFLNLVSMVQNLPKQFFANIINKTKELNSNIDYLIDVEKVPRKEAEKIVEKAQQEILTRHKYDTSSKGATEQAIIHHQLKQIEAEMNQDESASFLRVDFKIKLKNKEIDKIEDDILSIKNNLDNEFKFTRMKYQQPQELKRWESFKPLIWKKELTFENFSYSLPFTQYEYIENNGKIKCFNPTELIALNYNRRDEKVHASNSYIFGSTGSGKSTELKTTMKDEIFKGNGVLSIDIAGENNRLCSYLGGKNIIFSSETVEELSQTKKDLEEEIENLIKEDEFDTGLKLSKEEDLKTVDNKIDFLKVKGEEFINPLKREKGELISSRVNFLTLFFKKIFKDDFSMDQEMFFKKHLTNIYRKNNNEITFKELKEEFSKIEDENFDIEVKRTIVNFIEHIILNFKMFTQKTNLDFTDTKVFYNFDISEIRDDETLSDIVTFVVFKYIETLVQVLPRKKSNGEPFFKLVTIDEAHRQFTNKENMDFIEKQLREIRKYQGFVVLSSQTAADIFSGELSEKQIQGFFGNITYKVILKQDPSQKEYLEKLFNLDEAQTNKVFNSSYGEGILIMNNKKMSFKNTITPFWTNIYSLSVSDEELERIYEEDYE